MAKFNRIERKFADLLNSAPKIKETLKRIYISINYRLYKVKEPIELNDAYSIKSAADFFQVDLKAPYFYGYYDISPWSLDNQYYLVHEYQDKKTLKIILLTYGKKEELGSTTAWNWQQGAMLQWLDHENVIYNDFKDKILGSYIVNIRTKERTFIEFPVQAVFKKNAHFLSINYNTLTRLRPEYGYGLLGINFEQLSDESDGIWEVDYKTRNAVLILSLKDLKEFIPKQDKHVSSKINHVTYSPNGRGIVFMQRWYLQTGEKKSQLLYYSKDTNKISILLDNKVVSHYSWLSNEKLVVWANHTSFGKQYYEVNISNLEVSLLSKALLNYSDGHPSKNPKFNFILSDTYPNKARMQTLFKMDTENEEIVELAKLLSPLKYYGEFRCDLHPRYSISGNLISIDSVFDGQRKNYIINERGN